jgi:hypothetical protein
MLWRMTTARIRHFLIVLTITLVGTGMLLAQRASAPELRCDEDELIETQATLQASLAAFADDIDDDPESALEQLYEVGAAYQQLALRCGYIPPDIGALTTGDDLDLILNALATLRGDPLNGQLIYNGVEPVADGSQLACVGCHSDADTAPLTEGTWTRWDEIRQLEPELADLTFAEYMAQAIIRPRDHQVLGYADVMPDNYGDRLSFQNLADLIAYLESQDQLLD